MTSTILVCDDEEPLRGLVSRAAGFDLDAYRSAPVRDCVRRASEREPVSGIHGLGRLPTTFLLEGDVPAPASLASRRVLLLGRSERIAGPCELGLERAGPDAYRRAP